MTKHISETKDGHRTETIVRDNGDTVENKFKINPTGFDEKVSRTETKGSVPSDKEETKEK